MKNFIETSIRKLESEIGYIEVEIAKSQERLQSLDAEFQSQFLELAALKSFEPEPFMREDYRWYFSGLEKKVRFKTEDISELGKQIKRLKDERNRLQHKLELYRSYRDEQCQ